MSEQRSCADCVCGLMCRAWEHARQLPIIGQWALDEGQHAEKWDALKISLAETLSQGCPYFRREGARDEADQQAAPIEEVPEAKATVSSAQSCSSCNACDVCFARLRTADFLRDLLAEADEQAETRGCFPDDGRQRSNLYCDTHEAIGRNCRRFERRA